MNKLKKGTNETIIIDDKRKEISDESYEGFKKQFRIKDKTILWKPEGNDVLILMITGYMYPRMEH